MRESHKLVTAQLTVNFLSVSRYRLLGAKLVTPLLFSSLQAPTIMPAVVLAQHNAI